MFFLTFIYRLFQANEKYYYIIFLFLFLKHKGRYTVYDEDNIMFEIY